MNELLNRIFGLSSLGFGGSGVEFGFARPIPAWGWTLAVLLGVALAWWSYWRLSGSRPARLALAAGRAVVLLAILFLFSGPQLVRPNERIENDWVLVLLDRSASLTIADAPAANGMGRETRDQQLKDAVTAAWPAFATLSKDRTVQWLGFDSGVYDVPVSTEGGKPTGIDAGAPVGRSTAIGAAIDQALARAAARPISGIVILSDGRSIDEPSRQAMRRLQAERIPVFAVPLGSPDPIADLSLQRAEAPALAFVNDTVPVGVDIERLGASDRPTTGKVQLLDKLTGRVLDEHPIPEDPAQWVDHRAHVTLTSTQAQAGKLEWTVRIVPDTPDLIEQNNQTEVAVELVDRPLRVLYFDGYPRWEYRYLKNLLVREHSIQSAALLLASNRQYLREGDLPLDTLPRSPEEWAKFDVVILGDLSPALFSREQLEQLRDHVAVRGAGLLWIGGPGSTPGAWRDSPLADLLPFSLAAAADSSGSSSSSVRAYDDPVVMSPTPAATRLNLLELGETPDEGWPAKLSDPATGWSQLQYAQHIDPAWVKPTAEVLATFTPVSGVHSVEPSTPAPGTSDIPHPTSDISSTPAVLSMRYGAGRVLYVATDEIWRWRYARGEALPERFWLPFLRLQGRESLARASRPAVLETSPRQAEVDKPVRISVRILDQSLADAAPGSLTVRVRRSATTNDPATSTDLTLAPEQASGEHTGRSYATMWVPSQPGKYQVEVTDPALAGASLAAEVEVALSDDELRRPEADHALLANLTKQTEDAGGRILRAAQLSDLPQLLPKREVHIAGTPDIQTLWDRPAVLIALLLLLVAEWVGRRLIRLP